MQIACCLPISSCSLTSTTTLLLQF
uniref:Uncharacterized protein n=1 Tax=Rhizophora mucronata TaxID=61149 RepID=A0A2P2QRN5_RHIMU